VQNFRHHTSCRQEHRYYYYSFCVPFMLKFLRQFDMYCVAYNAGLQSKRHHRSRCTKDAFCSTRSSTAIKKKNFPGFLDFTVIYRLSTLHSTHTSILSKHLISLVLSYTVTAGLCCCIYKSAMFCPSKFVTSHVLQYSHVVIIILHHICCI